MGKLKRTGAALIATLMIFAGVLAVAPAASAACSLGTSCLWADRDYTGTKKSVSAGSGNLVGSALDGEASSIHANGENCAHTAFFSTYTHDLGFDKYVLLYSQTKIGSNYRDPYLSNGGGTSAYSNENWNDRIHSWGYYRCS